MLLFLVAVWQTPFKVFAQDPERIRVGDFSSIEKGEQLAVGWEVLTFGKIPEHTQYKSVKDGDKVVIRAQSQSSASGLIRKIEIDPREYPCANGS